MTRIAAGHSARSALLLAAVLLFAAGSAAEPPSADAPFPTPPGAAEEEELDEAFEDAPDLDGARDEQDEASEEEEDAGEHTVAEEEPEEPVVEAGWVPSIAIAADIQSMEPSATVASDLRGSFTADRRFDSAFPSLRFELSSPVLLDLPGRPRLFAHGGWQWGWHVIEEDRFVVQEGSPSEVDVVPSTTPTDPPPELVDGQGSSVDLRVDDGWYAGLGVSFVAPVLGLDLRIKPSLDYYRQDLRYAGTVLNMTCDITIIGGNRRCVKGTQEVQELRGRQKETAHAVGPRLGLEVDVAQKGPLTLSLFAEGFAYFWVDGDSTDFSATSGPDSARFSADLEDTVVGGSFGLRLGWRGF